MDLRLTVVSLGVDDLVRSAAFYEDGLGLKPSTLSGGDIRFYPCGAAVLALYPRKGLLEDAVLPQERLAPAGSFDGVTLACNCATRGEVDELLARARAAGGHIAKPAADTFWGGYSGYFEDMDGHLWEVAQGPMFELDGKGALVLPVAQ